LQLGVFLKNTVLYAGGAWLFSLAVDVTAAYALSKLRPFFGKVILAMMLATLMIPPMVLLLPTYLVAKDVPLFHFDLLNTPWAIWLPAAANGFFIFLLKRFFDSIPRELLEAAEIDGASPMRILWSIVLPVSRPILGVVSILSVVTVWKDFVWPLLVLPETDKMSISVGIASLSAQMPQNVLIASLVIASLPTILVFFVFQRSIMAGLTAGSLKG
jgi:multiple sugar transport system permease protein